LQDQELNALVGIGSPSILRNITTCRFIKFFNKVTYQINWIRENSNAEACDEESDMPSGESNGEDLEVIADKFNFNTLLLNFKLISLTSHLQTQID